MAEATQLEYKTTSLGVADTAVIPRNTSFPSAQLFRSEIPLRNIEKRSTLDLAVVGNCSYAALINKFASVVWMCFPRFDGDPVFCSLLRGYHDTGFWDIEMEHFHHSEQTYHPNTAVLSTRLYNRRGDAIVVTDFAPLFKSHDRNWKPNILIRMISPLKGRPRIRVRIRPTFGYGWGKPERTRGSSHIRYLLPTITLRITTNAPVAYILDETIYELDEEHFFILMPDESLAQPIEDVCRKWLRKTTSFWYDWTRVLSIPFEWQDEVIRACITLKLCSYAETGAVIGAITTSIPSSPQHGNNVDSRYCFLRHAAGVIHSLNRLGATATMEDFLKFINNVVAEFASEKAAGNLTFSGSTSGSGGTTTSSTSSSSASSISAPTPGPTSTSSHAPPTATATTTTTTTTDYDMMEALPSDEAIANIQPVYGLALETRLHEKVMHRLAGYRGQGPVRVGNRDYQREQHHVYGDVIIAVTQFFFDKRLTRLGDRQMFSRLELIGRRALEVYAIPDLGPRGGAAAGGVASSVDGEAAAPPPAAGSLATQARVHTFSAVLCWAATDRLAKIAKQLGLADRTMFWRSAADRIHADICAQAWNAELGYFTATFGGVDVDAYLLLLPVFGFLPGNEPRFVSTLERVEKVLRRNNYVLLSAPKAHSHLTAVRTAAALASAPGSVTTATVATGDGNGHTSERKLSTGEDGLYGNPPPAAAPSSGAASGSEADRQCADTSATFWFISAVAGAGRIDEARTLFENMIKSLNHIGLISENIHPETRELWGNFPSTSALVGLVDCAMQLSRPWEDVL